MKVVVCDDDPTLRSVVSRMAEAAGHQVLAETDSAVDAVELVTRFGAEVLVLDLSLPWTSGMEAITRLQQQGSGCQIVVFNAYADNHPELAHARVRAVIDKPDFDALEQVLRDLASGVTSAVERERRRVPRPRPEVPVAAATSPSGLEEPSSFQRVLDVLERDDAVLVVNVAGIDLGADGWAGLAATDALLAVARTFRAALRTQDRLGIEGDQLVALLLDGGEAGATSAFRRLERAHELTALPGVLSGGWAVHDGVVSPYSTFTRAQSAALRSVGQPPGERLWAG